MIKGINVTFLPLQCPQDISRFAIRAGLALRLDSVPCPVEQMPGLSIMHENVVS